MISWRVRLPLQGVLTGWKTGKIQSPVLGQSSFKHKNKLGMDQIEGSSAEKDLRVLVGMFKVSDHLEW